MAECCPPKVGALFWSFDQANWTPAALGSHQETVSLGLVISDLGVCFGRCEVYVETTLGMIKHLVPWSINRDHPTAAQPMNEAMNEGARAVDTVDQPT